jgi:hypothetical protein
VIDPKLEQELAHSKANDELTVLLQWTTPLDPKAFALIAPNERTKVARQHFQAMKAPVLDSLRGISGVELRDLPTSGSAILTTTVNRFRELIDKAGVLGQHHEVDVFPNEQYHTLAGVR